MRVHDVADARLTLAHAPFSAQCSGRVRLPRDAPDFAFERRAGTVFRGPDPDPAFAEAAFRDAPRLGRLVLGGVTWTHFGHFLAESIHRLWAAQRGDHAGLPVVFLAQRPGQRLAPWALDLLRLHGLAERVIELDGPAHAALLHIPEPGTRLGAFAEPWYLDLQASALAALARPGPGGPARIAVLRDHLGTGRLVGEGLIAAALEAAGYTLLRPETMGIADQMRLYAGAGHIVFSEGSALHLLEAMPPLRARVAVLCRRHSGARLAGHALRGRVEELVTFEDILALPPAGRDANHRAAAVLAPSAVLRFLADRGFLAGPSHTAAPSDAPAPLLADLIRLVAGRLPPAERAGAPAAARDLLRRGLARHRERFGNTGPGPSPGPTAAALAEAMLADRATP